MHLGEGTYELALLKEDILHYCQGLINQLKETDKLVASSFHSMLLGGKDFKDHGLDQEIWSIGKDIK